MEIVEMMLLFVIAIEGGLLLYKKEEKKEEVEAEHVSRRDIYGTFKDPYSYRKNNRGQYVPVRPGGKMIDSIGDEEE